METLTTGPMITRKKKVGLNVIELEVDTPRFLIVTDLSEKYSKKFRVNIPFFAVVDAVTGEEGILWIDGGIKGAFGGADNLELAVGKSFEITHKGLKALGETGQEVNSYEIYEVEITN